VQITGVGINAQPDLVAGEVERLEDNLEYFQAIGYDYVEIPVDILDVIYHGRLHRRRMADLKALLQSFNLKYTIHAPRVLDLRDAKDTEIQKKLFEACIAFTAEIGAQIFVYHYGRRTKDTLLGEILYRGMLDMATLAAEKGVQICVENIEIDTVAHVVEFVKRVEKENVGMTFDFGHAYLAARRFDFDFLESVKQARPYIRHIHVSDNFGLYEEMRLLNYERYKMIPYANRFLLGRGDLHLPAGWGEIPLDAAFKLLEDYRGIFMLEYYFQRYRPYSQEILEGARQYVKRYATAPKVREGA